MASPSQSLGGASGWGPPYRTMATYRRTTTRRGSYNQNDGVPGVVYILRNDAFKESWLKIGCSRHSGSARARDMNREASTGLPAHHVCVFECRTQDCGNAEKLVFQELRAHRKGRQEFFEVDIELAKEVISRVCRQMDEAIAAARRQHEAAARQAEEERQAAAARSNAEYFRELDERRKQATDAERRLRDEKFQRQQEQAARRLDEIRREREESDRLASLPPVDMTCPYCSVVLEVPGSAAVRPTQRLRCKHCLAVFQVNGVRIKSPPRPAQEIDDVEPKFEQRQAAPSPPSVSMWKSDVWAWVAGAVGVAALVTAYNDRPHKAPPLPTQTAVASTPAVQPKTQKQLLEEAVAEITAKYPYLDTKQGTRAVNLIIARRDALIAEGVEPVAALHQAASEIAPEHQPRSQ